MATNERMDIPTDEEFPFWVMERIDGRFQLSLGPFASLEEAVANVEGSPPGDYAISDHGRIVWPQAVARPYS